MDEHISSVFVRFANGEFEKLSSSEKRLISSFIGYYPTWLKGYLASQDVKKYYYLVTFTINRKICVKSDDDIEKYIIKQVKREPLKIQKAYMVREGGTKKHTHWHVALYTTKSLKKDRFHYYIKTIGNIDISKTNQDSLEEAINYISKENTPRVVVDLTLQLGHKNT